MASMTTSAAGTPIPSSHMSSKIKPFLVTTGRAAEAAVATRLAGIVEDLEQIVRREGEDAQITGQTRSLSRRLLGLNLRRAPESVPADSIVARQVSSTIRSA